MFAKRAPLFQRLAKAVASPMRLNLRKNTVAADDHKKVQRGYVHMPSEDKIRLRTPQVPAESSVGSVISDIARSIRERKFDDAWELFSSVEASHSTLSAVGLNLCAKARWWDRAMQVWNATPEEHKGVPHYTSMIDLCARLKRSRYAENFVTEMRSAKVEPNLITYNTLLNAYAMTGETSKADETFRSIPQPVLRDGGARIQEVTYGTLMLAWARKGNYARARELFIEMNDAGIEARLPHYNALLVACAAAEDVATAEGVFACVVAAGLKPDVPMYTIRLSCHKSNLEKCKAILEEMQLSALRPSAMTYIELLEAHVLAGDGAGAKVLIEKSELQDISLRTKLDRLIAQANLLPA